MNEFDKKIRKRALKNEAQQFGEVKKMSAFMMSGMHSSGLGWFNLLLIFLVIFFAIKLLVMVGVSRHGNAKENRDLRVEKSQLEHYHEAGLSDSDVKIFRENMAEAKKNIQTWEANLKKNDDLQVVESVTGGLEASKLTFKYIVQNPQELTKQNEFLYKDLPNMVKLTEKFLEMKRQKVQTEEISRDMDETLLLIKTLSGHISKNYHEILMDDVNVIKQEVSFDK